LSALQSGPDGTSVLHPHYAPDASTVTHFAPHGLSASSQQCKVKQPTSDEIRPATESKPIGLEEIGVSEALRTKRLKFGVPERSDRREEREFAEFQWRPKGLSRFVHSLDLLLRESLRSSRPFWVKPKWTLLAGRARRHGSLAEQRGFTGQEAGYSELNFTPLPLLPFPAPR
jgi:hypothetical protein